MGMFEVIVILMIIVVMIPITMTITDFMIEVPKQLKRIADALEKENKNET